MILFFPYHMMMLRTHGHSRTLPAGSLYCTVSSLSVVRLSPVSLVTAVLQVAGEHQRGRGCIHTSYTSFYWSWSKLV